MSALSENEMEVCPRHNNDRMVARCRDCGVGMCHRCAITIGELGDFCWTCATRRGGVHRRPRPRPIHRPATEAARDRVAISVATGGEATATAERFEALVDERGPRSEHGDLSRRLEAAGIDPRSANGGAHLVDEVVELVERAAAVPERRPRWWHRR